MKDREVKICSACWDGREFRHRLRSPTPTLREEESYRCYDGRDCYFKLLIKGSYYCLGRLEIDKKD